MDVIGIIENMGAFLRDDHFVYSSGKHGEVYINKNSLVLRADIVSDICEEFAKFFANEEIDVVVGPAIGGIALAQWTAFHLSRLQGREVLALFAEKDDAKNFSFTRGYGDYIRNKKVLVVDDLVNSSGTAKNIFKAIRANEGEIVALTVMINRNPREVNSEHIDGVLFKPLCVVDVLAYDPIDCPLCRQKRPINTTVGHGKKFLEQQ